MPNIFQQIGRTIEGKTQVGKILHEVLPFKKTRSALGSAILGIKKASPLPEFKDSAVREAVTNADAELSKLTGEGDSLDKVTKLRETDVSVVLNTINEARDILDDGKINSSPDDLSPKAKKVITQSFSALPIVFYLYYAITHGSWSFTQFFQYVQSFLGM